MKINCLNKVWLCIKKGEIRNRWCSTYRTWAGLWLRHSRPRNSSSSKSREAAEARRKAEGREQSFWVNWLVVTFVLLPPHTVKYKSQWSEVAIEARLLADSESQTLRREKSVTMWNYEVERGGWWERVWEWGVNSPALWNAKSSGKEIHQSLQPESSFAPCEGTQRTVKTPLILDTPMKTLTILRSTRISPLKPPSSNFLQKLESPSRCVSVSCWQFTSKEWTWSLTSKSCNFNALQIYLKFVQFQIKRLQRGQNNL